MSSIFRAAQDGDCARLRALLAEGQDVNARSPLAAPLHWAADYGQADAVALLLEHGADVGLRTTGAGWTPLHKAAYTACPRCIALLVAAGADVNAKMTSDSTTPLLLLVWQGGALRHKMTACAQLLIQAGARVDAADNDGDTPIWAAVRKGHRQLAKLLLRAGAVIPNWPTDFIYGEWNQSESVRRFVDQVKARGGWREHARAHKRVLVGLVAKCKPGFPDDAAGLVVEFWCPPGGF